MILGILQFLMLTSIVVYELKHQSPAVYLWATLLLMFGVMHPLEILIGQSYSQDVLDEASLFVIGFSILYLATRFVYFASAKRSTKLLKTDREDSHTLKNFYLLLMLVSFLLIVSTAISQGGILESSWGGAREASQSKSYLNPTQLFMTLYFAMGGVPLICFIKRDYKRAFLSALAILTVLIITRNRVTMLPLVVSVIGYFLYRMNGRITLKTILFAIIGSIVVVYFIYFIRVFRWMGTLSNAFSSFDLSVINTQVLFFLATNDGELGLRQWFYYFIEQNNDFPGFGMLHTYLRVLLVYFPTQITGGLKPDDFAIAMGSAIGMGEGGSMHPTLFGDCYANAGAGGVLLGIFWGGYACIGDTIIQHIRKINYRRLVYVLLGVSYVVVGRGAVYNAFSLVAWGIPVLYLFAHVRFNTKSVSSSSQQS